MTPLTQQELRSKLDRGDSLKSVEIGDVDFTDHRFEIEVNFAGAQFSGKDGVNFHKTQFSYEKGADFSRKKISGDGTLYADSLKDNGIAYPCMICSELPFHGPVSFDRAISIM